MQARYISELVRKRFGLIIDPPVFLVSVALIVFFVATTIIALEQMAGIYAAIQSWITEYTGWLFILLVQAFLILSVVLLVTRYGRIRLGGTGARPSHSLVGWLSMLFAAGMGIGLVFYSVAEPVFHYANPPIAAPETTGAAKEAMRFTFLHWGFHAWAIYAIVALTLAYFAFNRGLPLTIRSAFHPLIGERIYGWPGQAIDIFAVIATLFGIATSLGIGVTQIAAGLGAVFDIKATVELHMLLILVITLVALTSVVLGLDRGIKRLSEFNMVMAGLLMIFVLLFGPTLFILKSFVQNTGEYLQNFFQLSSWTEAYVTGTGWQKDWTVFYWAWWIAWSPFVGMFIARISYGRTIREFMLGVLLVPTVLTFIWMSVFGGTAINGAINGTMNIIAAVNEDVATAMYVMLEHLPLPLLTSSVAIVLVTVFFITSADSGALVLDTISSGGNTKTPVVQRIFWAVTMGVVASALLLGGGLQALQTGAITTGLPFAIILAIMCIGLLRELQRDFPGEPLVESPELAVEMEADSTADRKKDAFIDQDGGQS